MQQASDYQAERHTQFVLTFEETWPGVAIVVIVVAVLAGVGAYMFRKRR